MGHCNTSIHWYHKFDQSIKVLLLLLICSKACPRYILANMQLIEILRQKTKLTTDIGNIYFKSPNNPLFFIFTNSQCRCSTDLLHHQGLFLLDPVHLRIYVRDRGWDSLCHAHGMCHEGDWLFNHNSHDIHGHPSNINHNILQQ